MATKDINPGLLSKVARFVRQPNTDWSELEAQESKSGYSRQSLKAMIERKRQNDFIRRCEFDYLRKLRRTVPFIRSEHMGRPSFFQSSQASSSDERATTLKKIDDIEAQMSKQWWKGQQGATSRPMPVTAADSASFVSTQVAGMDSHFDAQHMSDYASTLMELPIPEDLLSAAPRSPVGAHAGLGGDAEVKLFSIETSHDLVDPELDEAAIRFANGDDAGSQAGLLAALDIPGLDPVVADGRALALFDLYRSTGRQSDFDRFAGTYVQRFCRAAPVWRSPATQVAAPAALVGEVLGDATAAMDRLQIDLTGVDQLLVSCEHLIRVDFSAGAVSSTGLRCANPKAVMSSLWMCRAWPRLFSM